MKAKKKPAVVKPELTPERLHQLEDIKDILLSRRAQVDAKVAVERRDQRVQNTHSADDCDVAQDGISTELGSLILQQNAQTLQNIDAALDSIANGEYGQCTDCRLEIAENRLKANPFAVRCRNCAEAKETMVSRGRY